MKNKSTSFSLTPRWKCAHSDTMTFSFSFPWQKSLGTLLGSVECVCARVCVHIAFFFGRKDIGFIQELPKQKHCASVLCVCKQNLGNISPLTAL